MTGQNSFGKLGDRWGMNSRKTTISAAKARRYWMG